MEANPIPENNAVNDPIAAAMPMSPNIIIDNKRPTIPSTISRMDTIFILLTPYYLVLKKTEESVPSNSSLKSSFTFTTSAK